MQPHVFCFWSLQSPAALSTPVDYRVLSDGCVDLLIDCAVDGRLIVAGTADHFSIVPMSGMVDYFGIRFLPGSFHRFFRHPLKDVANRMEFFEDVFTGGLGDIEPMLQETGSFAARIKMAERFLLHRLDSQRLFPDERFAVILHQMYRNQGRIRLEDGPGHGISPRQLRRWFDRYVGVNPKSFLRIVRFQSLLDALLRSPKNTWTDLSLEYGFYDQSHFIREFKQFTGLTPASLLRVQ